MRIFYASDTTPNSFFSSNLWENNLFLPLTNLGHDVIKFKYDLTKTFQNVNKNDPLEQKFIKRNRPALSIELTKQIKAEHAKQPIDLFFSYFYDACVLPETIDEIKSLGIKTVNWYCNGSYQLDLVSEISPHYDYCLVPEKFRLSDYKKIGARPIYCQEAANPNIYKPYDVPTEFDVTFVGQAYGDRPEYIRYLLDRNIDVHVWGLGWNNYSQANHAIKNSVFLHTISRIKKLFTRDGQRFIRKKILNLFQKTQTFQEQQILLPDNSLGPVLSDTDMIKLYSRSKINLGFSACDIHNSQERILQIRLRDFEIPMSGGFYMVEYMQELEEFFDIGKEVVCYHNKEDLAEKITYYLKHETVRKKISDAGYNRCLKDHTWHKRFIDSFKQMEFGLEKSALQSSDHGSTAWKKRDKVPRI